MIWDEIALHLGVPCWVDEPSIADPVQDSLIFGCLHFGKHTHPFATEFWTEAQWKFCIDGEKIVPLLAEKIPFCT